MSKRIWGPTPCGGAYSEAYYYDKDGKETDEEHAVSIHIHEYKADGTFIQETIAVLKEDVQ